MYVHFQDGLADTYMMLKGSCKMTHSEHGDRETPFIRKPEGGCQPERNLHIAVSSDGGHPDDNMQVRCQCGKYTMQELFERRDEAQ